MERSGQEYQNGPYMTAFLTRIGIHNFLHGRR
jgi:hypothetical protein